MRCPICSQDLLAIIGFDAKVSHLNGCTGAKGAVTRQTASVKTFTCPLCCKCDVSVNHIKKCAKNYGVPSKHLVTLADKRVKSRHFVNIDVKREEQNEQREYRTDDETNLQNKFTNHVIREIKINAGFVDEVKHCVVQNHIESTSPSLAQLPLMWTLSSLTADEDVFTVNGFDKYCLQAKINNDLTGFFVDDSSQSNTLTAQRSENVLDNSGELLTKLKSFVNKPTHCDLIIKADDKKLVYAHSFIWKLHSLTGISAVKKHLSIIECEEFKDEIIIEFLNYCYSGIMNVNQDNLELLTKLAHKFDCKSLIDLLNQRSQLSQTSGSPNSAANSD